MKSLKAIAVATMLTVSSAGVAFAADNTVSPLDALSSATSLSFETVSGPEVMSANDGADMAQVDLTSLKSMIEQNPQFMAQLKSYGATIDQVVGIDATNEKDVTILIQS